MNSMPFCRQKHSVFLIFLFGLLFSSSAFTQDYDTASVPAWVSPVQIPARDEVDQQNHSNGTAYLLVDRQWRVNEGQQSYYDRIVSKALNTSGVTEISQVSIDFDPVYESVILHKIMIHRDGQIIDRIDRSQINLIQREKDLDYQIYDGSKTLNIFIEDVREGDTVEYSYTVEGLNPVLSGHFSKHLKMRWGVPIERLHYRVLWLVSRPLHIRNHETEIEPKKLTSGRAVEYIWEQDKLEELISDDDTPGWYEPFPEIYLSDIANWGDVADWALPLYQPVLNTQAQKEIITPILETTDTSEQRVLAALRFVQDEVRYLGFEMGVRSHKPNAPDTVIKQRYGDCKDKSRLLVSLLQGMDIEASSVLVNTDNGMQVKDMLPTPTVFNHAIVLVRLNGQNYWLDPTRNYQNGNLDAVYQPNYHYALVISDQTSDLVKISDDINVVHGTVVEETFDLSDAIEKPATYKILTHYERYYADSMREELSETNPKKTQQNYLNYMTHYFPRIKVAEKIKIDDDSMLNKLTVTEQYTVPDIWTKSDDERYILADFEPYLMDDKVTGVEASIRTMPYSVTHPVRFQHTTRIVTPEGSSFDNEFDEIEDKAFRFSRKVDFSNDVLLIDYVYESLSDHVLPEDIKTYSDKIREVKNLSFFQISMVNPAINFGEYQFSPDDINWSIVSVVLLALISIAFASFRYIYLYEPPYQVPGNINPKLEGLGGWLILPALAVVFTPIRILVESKELWYIFSAEQWSMLEDNLGSEMLFIISFEMIVNVALIVMALFLTALFFTRRHTLPRFFIAYFIFALVVHVADLLIIQLLSIPGIEVAASDIQDVVRSAIFVSIWSLYFIKSERVKSTFTRRRGHRESLALNEVTMNDVHKITEIEEPIMAAAEIRPVKTILIGLVMAVFVVGTISLILAMVFGALTGADLTTEKLMLDLAGNNLYLVSDLFLTFIALLMCGYVAVKHVPSEEIKYGLILGVITFVLYGVMLAFTESISAYPTWYLALSILIVIPAVLFGAKRRMIHATNNISV